LKRSNKRNQDPFLARVGDRSSKELFSLYIGKKCMVAIKKKSNNGKLPRKQAEMQVYAFTFFS
jgi:hypothetical protein